MAGTSHVHPKMLTFMFKREMAADKDEWMVKGCAVAFDAATINDELGFHFEEYPREEILWNPTEEILEEALRVLGVE